MSILIKGTAYPVDIIETHPLTDGDELLAIKTGKDHGQKAFPGIQHARVVLADAGLHDHEGDLLLVKYHKLCVGMRGGFLDEHTAQGKRTGSAGQKMISRLDLDGDRAIQEMLAYSLQADGKSICTPFEWDALVKAWWELNLSFDRIFQLYSRTFDGLYYCLSGNPHIGRPSQTFQRVLINWLITRLSDGSQLPARIKMFSQAVAYLGQGSNRGLSQFNDLAKKENTLPTFNLQDIWWSMIASGIPEAWATDVVHTSLDGKFKMQMDYLAAKDEFARAARYVAHSRCRVAVITSDNPQTLRAARNSDKELDVLIQMTRTGSVNVFATAQRADLSPVAANLRDLESFLRKQKPVPHHRRLDPGTLRERPEWFNWVEDGRSQGAFGGPKKKAPGAPHTILAHHEPRVVEAVLTGLSSSLARIK